MTKMPTVPSLALNTLKIVSAVRQKLNIRKEKELKLLVTKNPDCSSFR